MRMSKDATAIMQYLAEQYMVSGEGRFETWTFTPDEADRTTAELRDLRLIRPFALGGLHVLTPSGHQWIMDNRKLEDDVIDYEFHYPDTFVVDGEEHRGQRILEDGEVLISCAHEL